MKKILVSITCLFLLASCHQEGVRAFHIHGSIDDVENDTEVLLQIDKEQNLETLARTTVHNHLFAFNGVQDSTIECNITYMQNGHKIGATFFLENGHIKINLSNETSHITGTPTNDCYQQFLNKINAIYAQIGSAYNEIPEDAQMTNSQDNELKEKIDELNKKANDLIFNTIEENVQNAVGYHLFCRFNQNLTSGQQDDIIKKLPVHWRRTSVVEDIRSQLSILPPDSLAY